MKMNVRKLNEAIGARVLVSFPVGEWVDDGAVSNRIRRCSSLGVYCNVVDVRKVWDRIDLLVSPESGSGQGWVSLSRVERTNSGVCDFAVPASVQAQRATAVEGAIDAVLAEVRGGQ